MEVVSADGPAEALYPLPGASGKLGQHLRPAGRVSDLARERRLIHVKPASKSGRRAVLVETSPAGLEALVDVHATTVAGYRSRLSIRRMADGGYLINGSIGVNASVRRLVTVASDPKAILAAAWARALQDAGIEWDRSPNPITIEGDATDVLAEVTSATFDSIASEVNRRSLNIGAELLLQWAGGRDHAPELLTEHVNRWPGWTAAYIW
jgi:D-alanyl-D-alanine carboxypeptidase